MARLPDKTAQASQAKVNWQAALAEHSRWLRTVAYARLRDREAVEEVLQEVALAAVRQAAPLRDASKAAPWLYRLVVRQVLLYRRRHGRQRRLRERFADRLDRSPDQEANDPLEWLLLDERRRHVR